MGLKSVFSSKIGSLSKSNIFSKERYTVYRTPLTFSDFLDRYFVFKTGLILSSSINILI